MATVTVDVDVDLDDFDTEELLEELKTRGVSPWNDSCLRDLRNKILGIDTLDKEIKLDEFLEQLKK